MIRLFIVIGEFEACEGVQAPLWLVMRLGVSARRDLSRIRTLTCAIVSGIPAQHQNIPDAFEAQISCKIEFQSQIRP
jgi:hypothetical protein